MIVIEELIAIGLGVSTFAGFIGFCISLVRDEAEVKARKEAEVKARKKSTDRWDAYIKIRAPMPNTRPVPSARFSPAPIQKRASGPKTKALAAPISAKPEPTMKKLVLDSYENKHSTKIVFANLICKQLDTISKAELGYNNSTESALKATTKSFITAVSEVMLEYANITPFTNEMQLPVRRIVSAVVNVVQKYGEYRNIATKPSEQSHIRIVQEVIHEIEESIASLHKLQIDRQSTAIDNLSVELKVLRDINRI